MFANLALLSALLPLATAHFNLNWPAERSSDTENQGEFPCGGHNDVSAERVQWPIENGFVQTKQGHAETNIKVYLALGNDPGENFNISLTEQFTVEGMGDFCIGGLSIPEGVEVQDGMNATIQVVTNAHAGGGLYSCADVTLTSQPLGESEASQCKNGTNMKITESNIQGNPNETASGHHGGHGGHEEPSSTAGGEAASATPSGLAGHNTAITWSMAVVGAAAFALGL